MEFETYYVGLLMRGPNWSPEQTPEIERLQAEHVAHKVRMAQAGYLVMNGPCSDDGNLRGISVYKVGSLAEAQALAAEDPMVKIGRLVVEFHPWMVPVRPPA
jgi:uncharacterized protein YciI